jgi:hypothetical protein
MRGGMLEPVCTSLVELADKVSSDMKKNPESENGAVHLKNSHTRKLLQAHFPFQKKKVTKTDR